MSEMLELADEFESTKTYVVLHYVDGSKGLTKQQQLSIAAALRSSADSAVSASVREAAERVLATAQSADQEQTQALGDLRSALDAEPQTAPKLEALESCKGEQLKFEEWAAAEKYDMHEHPLHYLFMDDKTNAARQGWKAALRYAATVIAGAQCQAESASVREVELEEALKNLMGIYDTPVSRRRYPQDQFMKEALDIARAALTRPEREQS